MAITKYSASRVGTFESCKLKYDLSYRRGYYAEETVQSVLTRKETAFHMFAETYEPTWTEEEILQHQKDIETKWNIPEEYSLTKPIRRFIRFYNEFIDPAVKAGAKYHREIQFDFDLDSSRFTGKLDVLLEYPNGAYHIIDYKTGKSTNTSYYTDQMFLYAWALHKQYNVPVMDMMDKIKISVFFGFADPDKEDPLSI